MDCNADSTPVAEVELEAVRENAKKIYTFLAAKNDWTSRKTLYHECFGRNLRSVELSAAIEALSLQGHIDQRQTPTRGALGHRTDYRIRPAAHDSYDLDFQDPDYPRIFQSRAQRLQRLRTDPARLAGIKRYYRDHPAQFVSDWGVTYDPGNIARGQPSLIPFVLYPRQVEWVDWVLDHWRHQRGGLVEKTRQMGLSWVAVALSCTLCLFQPGLAISFGSRKKEYVDQSGDHKSIMEKARIFMGHLPPEFTGGWDPKKHAHFMRILFPGTGASLTGEIGDEIGRGNTVSIYFVDEAAFLEHPELVDRSLSQATHCRIDISTPNGLDNPFAERRFSGKTDVFTFHWRHDPRKDDTWYQKQVAELDPVTLAQEVDIDYGASVDRVVIPSAWVQAALDAHLKLGITPTGDRLGALDVADEGRDLNAFGGRYGSLLEALEEWSGKGSDIYSTVERAFHFCDLHGYRRLRYDSDGLGAGVRGDARQINNKRKETDWNSQIRADPFRGSEAVRDPDRETVPGRRNKDFFANAKAQAWWALRSRFQATYRAVVEKQPIDLDSLICLPSTLRLVKKLVTELSQPTYSVNAVGKILIDKKPEGMASPNLADTVMMLYCPTRTGPIEISESALGMI